MVWNSQRRSHSQSYGHFGAAHLPASRMERSRFWAGAIVVAAVAAGLFTLLTAPTLP